VAVDVVCPTCNTLSHLQQVERDATCFCPTCDYPLFWAELASFAPSPDGQGATNGDGGRRRLPGTEGRATPDKLACPACVEPNLVTESYCVRCGADLHPKPPAPPYVAPPPAPKTALPTEAVVVTARRRRLWPWVAFAGLPIVGLVSWLLVSYV